MRPLLAIGTTAIVLATPTATAEQVPGPAPPPAPPDIKQKACGERLHDQAEHAHYARRVYRHREQISKPALRRLSRLRRCQYTHKDIANADRLERQLRAEYRRWQRATPYRCGGHHFQRWAIPCYVIACESSFENLGPNSASAAGYYQMLTSTWNAYGGRRYATAAYLAGKRQQDLVAARIWAGGGGAGQWVCS